MGRISQELVEVAEAMAGEARLTQELVEVSQTMTGEGRLSQVLTESAQAMTGQARLSQVLVEVVVSFAVLTGPNPQGEGAQGTEDELGKAVAQGDTFELQGERVQGGP